MTTGLYRRNNISHRQAGATRTDRANNFFLALLGFSLFVHVLLVVISLHNPASTNLHRPPAVYVDLVMAPVANPQRGSASAITKVIAPVVAEKPLPLPAKVAKEPVVLKSKEAQKKAPAENYADINKDIEKFRKSHKEQDDLNIAEAAIAAMKKKTIPTTSVAAAVGSATGSGDEVGSAIGDWLQKTVKDKWTWTDRKRKNLSAEVEVEFDSSGKLADYRILLTSGDTRFDKSLTDALLKLEALPKPLRKPFKDTIVFNLDDLQGQ